MPDADTTINTSSSTKRKQFNDFDTMEPLRAKRKGLAQDPTSPTSGGTKDATSTEPCGDGGSLDPYLLSFVAINTPGRQNGCSDDFEAYPNAQDSTSPTTGRTPDAMSTVHPGKVLDGFEGGKINKRNEL